MDNWLESLKPGDKVIVRKCDRCYQQPRIEVVKSVGKKFISLEGWESVTRFRADSGFSVRGGMLDSYELFPVTEEYIKKIEQQKQKLELVRKLEKTDFGKLPIEVLKQITEIIEGNRNI
jgi:transcription-repair coupling factor (superfamily II helicase)